MGAAPSREVATHNLPRAPFYGQRQQIVLIPLLKDFFPSPDSVLFQQLYDARCDPAVRYYHYAQERTESVIDSDHQQSCRRRPSSHHHRNDEVVGIACSPADVFPTAPCTREELYKAYVEDGGERLVYETDEAMLEAFQADPKSVRPLPCAVAFYYPPPENGLTPAGDTRREESPATFMDMPRLDGEATKEEVQNATGKEPIIENNQRRIFGDGAEMSPGVEGCVSVLGCYVKATGFVGDISRLFSAADDFEISDDGENSSSGPRTVPVIGKDGAGQLPLSDGYELDLYLTKSAGDHNRTHVLLSATYTYAEQWQRACLRCGAARQDITDADAKGESERGGRREDSQTNNNLDEAANHEEAPTRAKGVTRDVYDTPSVFAASTSAFYKRFGRALIAPEPLQSLFQHHSHSPTYHPPCSVSSHAKVNGAPAKGEKAYQALSEGAAQGDFSGKPLDWAPPPLAAVRMRGRRTNVPLLCFLREVRAILLGIHAVNTLCAPSSSPADVSDKEQGTTDTDAEKKGDEEQEMEESRLEKERAVRKATLSDLILWLEDVLSTNNTSPSSTEKDGAKSHTRREEALIDTLLNIYAPSEVVRALVEHIMVCLLHSLNPQEILRSIDRDGVHNGSHQHQHQRGEGEATDEAAAEEGDNSNHSRRCHDDSSALPAQKVPNKSLDLRLPDEDSIVEAWPPSQAMAAAVDTNTITGVDLTALKQFLPTKHLYWVVGPTHAERSSATASLLDWQREGNLVYVRDDIEETRAPHKVDATPGALMAALASLHTSVAGEAKDGDAFLLDAGLAIEFLPAAAATADGERESDEEKHRALCVRRLPLEEALLGELSDACKQAREAGPSDKHWVRSETQRTISEAQREDTVTNADVAPRPPEAMDVVGDGASCLYRVLLASNAARIIAVTPCFLKVQRKKPKKKNTIKARGGTCGTAINVFYAAPALPEEPPVPSPQTGKKGETGAVEKQKDATAGSAVADATEYVPKAASEARKEEAGGEKRAHGMDEAMPATTTSDTTAVVPFEQATDDSPPPMSKAQKKKAKKKAAAAAAAAAAAESDAKEITESTPPSFPTAATTVPAKDAKATAAEHRSRDASHSSEPVTAEMETKATEPHRPQHSAPVARATPPAPTPIDANLEEYRSPLLHLAPPSMGRQTTTVSSTRSSLSPSAAPFNVKSLSHITPILSAAAAVPADMYSQNGNSSGGGYPYSMLPSRAAQPQQTYGSNYLYPQQQQPQPHQGSFLQTPAYVAPSLPPPPPPPPISAAGTPPYYAPPQQQHSPPWMGSGCSATYGGTTPLPPPPHYYNPAPGPDPHLYGPPPPPPAYDGSGGPPTAFAMFAPQQQTAAMHSQMSHRPPPAPRSAMAAAAAAAAAAARGEEKERAVGGPSDTSRSKHNSGEPSAAGSGEAAVAAASNDESGCGDSGSGTIGRRVSFDVEAMVPPSQSSPAPAGEASEQTALPATAPVAMSDLVLLPSPPSQSAKTQDQSQHDRVTSLHNWERSSTSQLLFHPENMNSPMAGDGANFPAAKPTLEASLTVSNMDGAGSGSGMRVTVVRRHSHHHQHHHRTGSYISDVTTNDGTATTNTSLANYNTNSGTAALATGGGGGLALSRSVASFGSLTQPHHPAGTHNPYAATVVRSGSPTAATAAASKPPMSQASASGRLPARPASPTNLFSSGHSRTDSQPQQQLQHQPQAPAGVTGSVRSGDTNASGPRHHNKSGHQYRWDWRSVTIDYLDEDS